MKKTLKNKVAGYAYTIIDEELDPRIRKKKKKSLKHLLKGFFRKMRWEKLTMHNWKVC